MKRILTILLIVMMVFSITGCDPEGRAGLASFMGKMGQNVMGSDTSAAANIANNAKVDKSEIKTGADIKGKKTAEGKIPVEVGSGLKIELSEEDAAKVESVLPPMKAEQKDTILEDIGSALQNTDSTNEMIKNMKAPYGDADVEKAAKGTATVMKSALKQVAEALPAEVPADVKSTLGKLGDSLDRISENTEGVTKADVVTLQLVQSFVETVNTNKDEIKPGNVPEAVLSDANNLLTVASALSEASKFDPLSVDFAAVIPSENVSGAPSRSFVAAARGEIKDEAKEEFESLKDLKVSSDVQSYVHLAYDIVYDIIGNGSFAATKSGLSFHKMSYENYANMAATKLALTLSTTNDEKSVAKYLENSPYLKTLEFKEFRTFSGLMQYAAAAALSEGDDYYLAFKSTLKSEWEKNQNAWADTYVASLKGEVNTEQAKAAYIKDISAALGKLPGDIKSLIDQIEAENSWVKIPVKEEVSFTIPAQFKALENLPLKEIGKIAMGLMTGRNANEELIEGADQYFRTTMETLSKMIVFTDLSSISKLIGDKDLNYLLLSSIDKLYVADKPAENN